MTDRLAAYLDRFRPSSATEADDVARVRATVASTPDPWDRNLPLHVTASAVIVHPPSGQVLLRWHQRQQAWLQAGGHADPGESDPYLVARRESEEETGLTDLVPFPPGTGPALVHVVLVPVPAGKGEPAHEHADLRFVLATAAPEDAVAETADAPLRWLGLADARELTAEENLRVTLDRVEALLSTADDRHHDAVDG